MKRHDMKGVTHNISSW